MSVGIRGGLGIPFIENENEEGGFKKLIWYNWRHAGSILEYMVV